MALLLSCCWLCGLWAAAQEMEAVAPTLTPERYQNGWYGMAQTQTLFGETTNKQATVHLGTQGAAGYRFHPALQVGLGVGVAAYLGQYWRRIHYSRLFGNAGKCTARWPHQPVLPTSRRTHLSTTQRNHRLGLDATKIHIQRGTLPKRGLGAKHSTDC